MSIINPLCSTFVIWFCVCISEYIFTFCVMCMCVFFFFFSFFHKVASLLGLCLFWQPATWFIYVQLLHYIAIRVVANKVLSISLRLPQISLPESVSNLPGLTVMNHWQLGWSLANAVFSHAGPKAWKSLPHAIQEIADSNIFKHKLTSSLLV